MKKLVLSVFGVGLLAGSLLAEGEAHFKFTVSSPVTVAGNKLKPGDYKVDVEGSEASFKLDGKIVKVPATIQTETRAFKETTMEASDSNVKAIHIGGTVISILFVRTSAGN
jgi:hypothetical protein